jgi:hypothetical protein
MQQQPTSDEEQQDAPTPKPWQSWPDTIRYGLLRLLEAEMYVMMAHSCLQHH